MNDLFRKKSLDRVNSPEQLNDYIRVASPGVWPVVLSVLVLLVGIFVWVRFGHVDATVDAVAICQGGTMQCYIDEADISQITDEVRVSLQGESYSVSEVSAFPVVLPDEARTAPDKTQGYVLTAAAPGLPDGCYEVSLISRWKLDIFR